MVPTVIWESAAGVCQALVGSALNLRARLQAMLGRREPRQDWGSHDHIAGLVLPTPAPRQRSV